MKNTLLLPHKFKAIGWAIFLLFSIIGFSSLYLGLEPSFMKFNYGNCGEVGAFDCSEVNLLRTIAFAGTIIGLLVISFSKEKKEDEYISILRLKSWQWSVLISYVILLIVNFSFYGLAFFGVLFYNVFTILIVFILKFTISIYKFNRSVINEN